MKTITIKGNFTGSVNSFVVLDVFRPNGLPMPYNFSKMYHDSFTETLTDLQDDTVYNIDFSGFASGSFDIEIDGQIQQPPITDSFSNSKFSPAYAIQTN